MGPLVKGLLAGLVGTTYMTAGMGIAKQSKMLRTDVMPRRITRNLGYAAGVNPRASRPIFEASWLVQHFLYGAAAGAALSFLSRRVDGNSARAESGAESVSDSSSEPQELLTEHPAARGALFGAVVWAISYLGWVPALKLYPPVTREPSGKQHPASRAGVEVLLHFIFGISTAYALQELGMRGSGARRREHQRTPLPERQIPAL